MKTITQHCPNCKNEYTKTYTTRKPTFCDDCKDIVREKRRYKKIYTLNTELNTTVANLPYDQQIAFLDELCIKASNNTLENPVRQAMTNPKLFEKHTATYNALTDEEKDKTYQHLMIRLNAHCRQNYGMSFQKLCNKDVSIATDNTFKVKPAKTYTFDDEDDEEPVANVVKLEPTAEPKRRSLDDVVTNDLVQSELETEEDAIDYFSRRFKSR